MDHLAVLFRLTSNNNRPCSIHVILLMAILLLDHNVNKINKTTSGQAIIPFLQPPELGAGNGSTLRLFLQPCEVVTLQTQCTEEEYENNEDCLPQKKDNCDRSRELFCLSGVCLPNCHPHKETYDHVEGKCFRKVGSDCRSLNADTTTTKTKPVQIPLFQNDNEESNQEEENQQQQHSTVIVPECEKNAVCEKGQCRCAKNYTFDHNYGKCMLSASYSSYCNDTITCDRKSDIDCKENQCQCKSPEIQYIHLKRKRCYILIGQVCSTGLQFCPDNSNCVRRKVPAIATVEEGKENNDLLFSSSTTRIDAERNSSIENDPKHFLLRLYEEHHGRNGFIDGQDMEEEEHFIGIWGDDEEDKEYRCQCEKGYGSTRDKRFCLGLHGARCNTLHRCNMERGLKCVDGVCRCEKEKGNEQIFSEQFQTCITRIAAPCIDDGKGERAEDICPIGGSCKGSKCTCDKGLTPSSAAASSSLPTSDTASIAYSCVKSHGMACKNNGNNNNNSSNISDVSNTFQDFSDLFQPPCNHEIGLECNSKEEKCLCKDSNQFYDVRMKRCRIFQSIDTKIPVIHFTPPDDREYNFRRNSGSRILVVVVLSPIIWTMLLIF